MTQSKTSTLDWKLKILLWGITVLIVGGILGILAILRLAFDTYFPPLTAEEKNYCQLKAACGEYQTARQTCAVAGDYSNCMSIKLGSRFYALQSNCDSDGNLRLSTANAPPDLRCLLCKKGLVC